MWKAFRTATGFTLVEVVVILLILSILTAVAVSRARDYNVEVRSGIDALKSHLRYAQTVAMNYNPQAGEVVWGIKGSGSKYWLFQGTGQNEDIKILLPEDSQFITVNREVELSAKKISLDADFKVYFDGYGIPYTAYATSTNNTQLASNLQICMSATRGSGHQCLTITPRTGYIP